VSPHPRALYASPSYSHPYKVSQFTLLASTKKGNKPDFHQSASGVKAKTFYQSFFKQVQDQYQPERVKDGLFAAMMDVALVNDGPVGLDYTCIDNEVQPRNLISRVFSTHARTPADPSLSRSLFKSTPSPPNCLLTRSRLKSKSIPIRPWPKIRRTWGPARLQSRIAVASRLWISTTSSPK
jgi:hypothetical protein